MIHKAGAILLKKAKHYRHNYLLTQITRRVLKAQNALGNQNLMQFLKWKYTDEHILERCGEIYPVVVFPAPDNQIQSPDSVLLSLERNKPGDSALWSGDAKYRELQYLLVGSIQDRLTFTMKQLVTGPQLGLKCELGTYFKSLDTCDSLGWEILNEAIRLIGSDVKTFKKFDKQLLLRSLVHKQVRNPVYSGNYRSAAIGISTLIAYKEKDNFFLWLKKRSPKGAVGASLFHVIPSCMFQPVTLYLDEEFSVTHNVYREYLEEIFNKPELEEHESDWRYFYADARMKYLQHLIDTNEAKLYLSGVAVNLLNLRPEICTVLLIRSEEWYKKYTQHSFNEERFHFNGEWAELSTENPDLTCGRIPYKTTDEEIMKNVPLQVSNMIPSGAAAFWLGIDVLRQVL
ncbi:MAG: hypothetical protein E3K32_13835 [wastewater metagenome]|nr:hypothetical protein [Candidatus Loosdrechtia aerotolerans]